MEEFQVPGIAVAFIYGNALNQTLTNQSYFNFTLQQSTIELGGASHNVNVSMTPNCVPGWLGNLTNTYKNLSCINPNSVKLQGVVQASPVAIYPRIIVNLCNNISGNCSTLSELLSMTGGGRVFLFLEKAWVVDYKSGKLVPPS